MVATFDTIVDGATSLSDFAGFTTPRATAEGINSSSVLGETWSEVTPGIVDDTASPFDSTDAAFVKVPLISRGTTSGQQTAFGDPWFEEVTILPRELDLGLIFNDQEVAVEIYNSDRFGELTLSSITNPVTESADFTDAPALPFDIASQRSLFLTLAINVDGPPSVDDTITFEFDGGSVSVGLDVSFSSVVIWGADPEGEYTERLEFLVEVFDTPLKGERRVRKRLFPRQLFTIPFRFELGAERELYENIVFNSQACRIGLPIHEHATSATSPVSVGDTVLNVISTDDADYRVGGLVVVLTSQNRFDVQEVVSFTSTTITLAGPTVSAHDEGVTVAPLRFAFIDQSINGSRFRVGLADMTIGFRVVDNDVDLADDSLFGQYNGKPLIDADQWTDGTSSETFERDTLIFDPGTGLTFEDSIVDRGQKVRPLVLVGQNRAESWALRKFMHAIGGRWKSFFTVARDFDITPTADLTGGSDELTIANIGYTNQVRARTPKGIIRVVFTDDTSLIRVVSGSIVVDENVERLTLSETWPATYTVDQVRIIEYVEPSRYDSDTITITHMIGAEMTRYSAPVRQLLT